MANCEHLGLYCTSYDTAMNGDIPGLLVLSENTSIDESYLLVSALYARYLIKSLMYVIISVKSPR